MSKFSIFHPDMVCSIDKYNVSGIIGNNEYINVNSLHVPENYDITLVRGGENPLRGWCCLEYGKLTPACSLGFIQHGTNAHFATHINLGPSFESVDSFAWKGSEINVSLNGNTFNIDLSGKHDTVKIDNMNMELTRINSLQSIIHGIPVIHVLP